MFSKYALPVIAIGLLGFAFAHVYSASKPTEKAVPMIEPPRSPFPNTVAGAGLVEAQTENISIGSAVPGLVFEVYAKVGQKVERGDELFRLDDRMLKTDLQIRRAAVASAQAQLTRLENQPRAEDLQISEARYAEAKANLVNMRDQYERTKGLAARNVSTQEDLVTREQMYRVSQAQMERAKSELAMQKAGAWQYDKDVARAAVVQAQAQVAQTEIELDRLTVRALESGQVLQVNVRPGEFVGAPANQALVVLGNVQKLHVRVDIDEYDIPRFKPEAPAKALLKGRPDEAFTLKFVRVEPYVVPKHSLTGDNRERVDTRVLQVIYSIDASDDKRLYVGQQLDVFVDVGPPGPAENPSSAPPPDNRVAAPVAEAKIP